MTTLISALSLQLETADGVLFQDLSFTLKLGDRIGLIGHNGCGKSTLLALLSGQGEADSGTLQRARSLRLQYVEQHLPAELATLSLFDALSEAIGYAPDARWRVEALLQELGFSPAQADIPVAGLSGGQHSRLLLGRALLHEPNLLLLDEPSNHLDLPALLWLEQFLLNWRGGFVLVSHDARLLDRVCRQSWILRDKRLHYFDRPCSAARAELATMDQAAGQRHAAEQKEIDRIDSSSQRRAIWGRTYDNEKLARKAKTMQQMAERLRSEQTVLSEGSPWRLQLHGQAHPADRLLALEQLSVRANAGLPPLFQVTAASLKAGDRVALLGANGMGKSSLLRQCWQAVQASGTAPGITVHAHAAIGYYDQSQQQLADGADLVEALEPYARLGGKVSEADRRHALISAGFAYPRHRQKVASLSGGERARLLFLGLSLASYHLLLLDEPSNHLDLEGKDELGDALAGFPGGVLLVSHDRDLIERSCNRFWLIRQGQLEIWQDAPSAYARLQDGQPQGAAGESTVGHSPVASTAAADDSDALLARLCELEARLAEDLARKPRQQRPLVQQQWRDEIAALSAQLGLTTAA
ncbi:ABC-F family ATP-binding cassette domain-containing protein [Chitinimonas sp.]|uniref:ABC-F family ATP-binding cassette domain-containing protein n=1 Tax=Chitinimonas sp. TaxID=1934313 RepID=UPI0035AEFA6A